MVLVKFCLLGWHGRLVRPIDNCRLLIHVHHSDLTPSNANNNACIDPFVYCSLVKAYVHVKVLIILYLVNQKRYRHTAITKMTATYDFISDLIHLRRLKSIIFEKMPKFYELHVFWLSFWIFSSDSLLVFFWIFRYVIQNFLGFHVVGPYTVYVSFLLQFVLGLFGLPLFFSVYITWPGLLWHTTCYGVNFAKFEKLVAPFILERTVL